MNWDLKGLTNLIRAGTSENNREYFIKGAAKAVFWASGLVGIALWQESTREDRRQSKEYLDQWSRRTMMDARDLNERMERRNKE